MLAYSVIVPARNESQGIERALRSILRDANVKSLVVVDDASDDGTSEIVRSIQREDRRVRLWRNSQRRGQLAAWIKGAALVHEPVCVFVDADSEVADGAIAQLAERCADAGPVGGCPVPRPGARAALRYSAAIGRALRRAGWPQHQLIGRFFAVGREWFLENVTRTDILANDCYIGVLALSLGQELGYVDDAKSFFTAPTTFDDFNAQRDRADRGYLQLARLGLLKEKHKPNMRGYASALLEAMREVPSGVIPWLLWQAQSRLPRILHPLCHEGDTGIWEPQASTKR